MGIEDASEEVRDDKVFVIVLFQFLELVENRIVVPPVVQGLETWELPSPDDLGVSEDSVVERTVLVIDTVLEFAWTLLERTLDDEALLVTSMEEETLGLDVVLDIAVEVGVKCELVLFPGAGVVEGIGGVYPVEVVLTCSLGVEDGADIVGEVPFPEKEVESWVVLLRNGGDVAERVEAVVEEKPVLN